MAYKFEYEDTVFISEDYKEVSEYVDRWLENNFDEFNQYVANRDSTLIKDNAENYAVSFFEDYVEEVL